MMNRRKTIARALAWSSYGLILTAVATCHFGVRHEVMKIPAEVRANMTDTDWVGVEWIGWSWLILVAAAVLRLIAFMVARLRPGVVSGTDGT